MWTAINTWSKWWGSAYKDTQQNTISTDKTPIVLWGLLGMNPPKYEKKLQFRKYISRKRSNLQNTLNRCLIESLPKLPSDGKYVHVRHNIGQDMIQYRLSRMWVAVFMENVGTGRSWKRKQTLCALIAHEIWSTNCLKASDKTYRFQ